LARPVTCRGVVKFQPVTYGYSVFGTPLQIWLPEQSKPEILIFAGIHGEEPESTGLLSRALRSLDKPSDTCAIILCANPDGVQLGTRGNANSVDLNRNFPSCNWQDKTVSHRWHTASNDRVALSPGHYAASEPETAALIRVIERLTPDLVISIHAPLGLIDDPDDTAMGAHFAELSGLPRTVMDTGNTPGSFGSWSAEQNLKTITYELPNQSIWEMMPVHLPILESLLEYGLACAGNSPRNHCVPRVAAFNPS
jgi:protein MpaA